MIKLYNHKPRLGEKDDEKTRFRCSPSDRRGRRDPRGRVGRGGVGSLLLPGDRSNVSNQETELAARATTITRGRIVRKTDTGTSTNNNIGGIVVARVLGIYVVKSYLGIFYKCASSVMGMFKWLRKDFVQWDRNRRNLSSPDRRGLSKDGSRQSLTMRFERRNFGTRLAETDNKFCSQLQSEIPEDIRDGVSFTPRFFTESRTNSEAYRNALQAFLDRRREPGEGSEASQSPKLSPTRNNRVLNVEDDEILYYKNANKDDRAKYSGEKQPIPGVPHIEAAEVFEVGWVAGTEDRYLELISAEWQHTRTALRRSSHPDCFNAVRADLEILTQIRHPHTLLLMGTTRTDEHGIVGIFESVDCTLYNYVHEQGERVSVQGAARCAVQIADAIRHAHARGIVHGAVSSHCVFLAASGTAKLGGWELAVREKEPRPYREWEERLRSEIFRWQAPEMFYGDAPSRPCDVYALALLIWEMCTGRVPWSGLNEVEIERQYIHWERGVAIDTYNFPPLLNNLLESGLQLDAGKRKLDMNRAHRFLRRLELQYEQENPIYVDRCSNNNNPQIKTFNAPVSTSPLVKSPAVTPRRDTIEIGNSLMGKKLFSSEKILGNSGEKNNPNNEIHSKKYESKTVNNESENKEKSTHDFKGKKNTNVYLDSKMKNHTQKDCDNVQNGGSEVFEKTRKRDKPVHSEGKRQRKTTHNVEDKINKRKTLVAYESSFSEPSTTPETHNSSSDETPNDTISEIKRLKEIIADKRTKFFYGDSSPTNLDVSEVANDIAQYSPPSRERILKEARGKSCEPCKPASHKINLEPQATKSPTEYNPTLIKPASHQNQRVPQSHISPELRHAISQPHTLNSSSSSFFETSLWRKEKLICLSKMRKYYPENDQDISITDKTTPSKSSESPKIDFTYTIENDAGNEESNILTEDSIFTTESNLTQNETAQSTPLQAIKEALDRATNIIRSVTPNTEESGKLSPVESLNNSDIVLDDTGVKEAIFESLNRTKLGTHNIDDEIQSIERSTIDDRDSLLIVEKSREGISPNKPSAEDKEKDKEKSKSVSFGKNLQNLDSLSNNDTRNNLLSKTSDIDDSLVQRLQEFTCHSFVNGCTDDPNESLNHLAEKSLVSTAMIFLSSKSQEKGCKSCQHRNLLARRRSLPAALGQFRSNCNVSPLGRLPIRRAEVPDSTVEDLYIDDEFGDNLNINMVLLEDEDEPDDQDLISSLLHSSNA